MKKLWIVMLILLLVMPLTFAKGEKETSDDDVDAEKPVLHILNYNVSTNLASTVEYHVITEVSGYSVNYEILPSEHASEILMLNMSMDNDYDAIVIQSTSDFQTLMSAGALLPLNEYIDKYAPRLWSCVSKEAWQGVSDAEGNVYALPATSSIKKEINTNMTVRLDLAEKAGLGRELPTTITEFYNYCKALKDFYGNEYTIIAGPDGSAFSITRSIMAAFGIYNDWMVDDDGKIIYMTEHKNFKSMIEIMNRLYREGILDSDYAINTATSTNSKFSSGKAIICINGRGTINPTTKALLKNVTSIDQDDLGFIPYLHSDDGDAKVMINEGYSVFTMIPRTNPKNAAHVIRYALSKVENQELFFIGEEGVHFYYDEDGFPTPIQPAFTDERNKANNYIMIKDEDEWTTQFYCRLRKDQMIWNMFKVCSIEINEKEPEVWVPAYFAFTTSEAYKLNNPNLRMNLNTYLVQLLTGNKTIDDSMSDFLKDFNVSGGEKVREELQAYYDETYR